MFLYNYNTTTHKDTHDETGGRLKDFTFQYYDCVCGNPAYKIVSTTTRHHNHFDVVRCSRCGTMRINPYLSDASIETYYKEVYGPVKRTNKTPEELYAMQIGLEDFASAIIPKLAKKDADILDYGAGAGGRMDKLKREGYSNIHLFDFDTKYMEYGVSCGFKAHKEGNRYDMVTLLHVLEHINDPVAFLQKLAKDFLKPGGMIYIEVPTYDDRVKLITDFHLAHKYYFTQPSLAIMTKIAGFKTVYEDKVAIVITQTTTPIEVSSEDYRKAMSVSNAQFAKARRMTRNHGMRKAIKNCFTSRKPK